jgi:hypothetical protein
LGFDVSLLGSQTPPLHRLFRISGHTLPAGVGQSKTALGSGITLLGGHAEIASRRSDKQ